MEEWGFIKHGYKGNGELVLVKDLKDYNVEEGIKFNYPLIQDNRNHYFLPIYPQYHTDLFPDNILNNEDMHLYEEAKGHRYALEKIYLTGAKNIRAKKGDLVVIYRIGERQPKKYSSVITGIAILADIIYPKTSEECVKICKNRSIFSEKDIQKLFLKYPVIIKLLDYKTFKHKVTLNDLYKNKILTENKGPRPFEYLRKEDFKIIYDIGMNKH